MTARTFDPVGAEERAYKASLTADVAAITAELLEVVGARDTAAGLGLADARPLYQWRKGQAQPKSAQLEQRLRGLYRVVAMVTEAYGSNVARAFLRSPNPQLDDRSVLRVLAEDDEGPVEILGAARALLEG